MKKVFVTFLTLLVVLAFGVRAIEPAKNGYSCDESRKLIRPCLFYLMGGEGNPTSSCCNGVSEVKASAPTREYRRAACQCLQNEAIALPNFRPDKAAILPHLCGVTLGFPINNHVDCAQIP